MKKEVVLAVGIIVTALCMNSIQNSDDLFAKKYAKNQATTQASNCGNNDLRGVNTSPDKGSSSTSCQNIDSQIQGDDNSVALAEVHNVP